MNTSNSTLNNPQYLKFLEADKEVRTALKKLEELMSSKAYQKAYDKDCTAFEEYVDKNGDEEELSKIFWSLNCYSEYDTYIEDSIN